jgi:ABC-type transport system involved in multi-copper enzyme maturation permease subunit
MLFGAALALLLSAWLGAWRIKHSWQEDSPTVLVSDLRRELLLPRFNVRSLNRSLARSLTANPIGWLHLYSPSARLVKWGWCLAVMLAEIFFSQNPSDLYLAQNGIAFVLLLGLAFSASGSFRHELESGAFELLLVTPLRERQIIFGRLRGLWRQFFPALIVYAAGNIYLSLGWSGTDHAHLARLSLTHAIVALATLPLIGLYFSVQRLNFFTAWLLTCLLGLALPWLGRLLNIGEEKTIALQLFLAISSAILLEFRLRRRESLQKQSA